MNQPVPFDFILKAAGCWDAIPNDRMPCTNHLLYEVMAGDTPYVMRLTDALHRSHAAILAEVNWINILAGKANVAKAIAARGNEWAIAMQMNGREMTACVFEKITGASLNKDAAWGREVFLEWGKTIARLHKLSSGYPAENCGGRRLDGEMLLAMAANMPLLDELVCKRLEKNWERLHQTIDAKDWGMIHGDLTQANMRYCNDRLYIFDFDNCQFAPFLYDLAITIYVTLWGIQQRSGAAQETDIFLQCLFEGYRSNSHLKMDAAAIRCLLDFFNALIYISCRRAGHHPFEQYAAHNLRHGTLADAPIEKYLQ